MQSSILLIDKVECALRNNYYNMILNNGFDLNLHLISLLT